MITKLFRCFPLALTAAFYSCFFLSCEDNHQDVYDDPPWLGGSIIETLEERGNYEIFLQLMEKAEYREPIEKGLFTVFAASDSAYEEYFKSEGIQSVDEISERDALQLFTLNIINTPRSRYQLIYDHVFGEWQGPGSELGALLWRIETKAESPLMKETVRYYPDLLGETVTIRSKRKFVPLLSKEFFRDYFGATDGSDYTYFFPNTPWSGLQWYNANIVEAEVRASNGFIYFLDRAVPTIPSIEEYLRQNQDKYGIYYDIAQRFAEYRFSGYDDDADKTRLYRKTYDFISDIADEGGPSSGDGVYQRRNAFSAFIPTDDVFQDYLDKTIYKYYDHIDSVPEVTLVFILQSHLTEHFELPSKMVKSFYNSYGDIVPIDPYEDVESAILLSNGAFFGMKKILEPYAFKGVAGPLFYNSNYTTFMYAINTLNLFSTLSKDDVNAYVFAPPNEKLEEYGIRYEANRERIEKRDLTGVWDYMSEEDMLPFVKDHIIYDKEVDFSGEGFVELSSKNYIYYNNNKIYGGGNLEDGDPANIVEMEDSEYNGILFHLDNAIKLAESNIASFIGNHQEFSSFYDLLYTSELLDTIEDPDDEILVPRLKFILEAEHWTAFIPDNEAIDQAVSSGIVPVDSVPLLQDFIRYHFIRENVIFDDGELSGVFNTTRIDTTIDGVPQYNTVEVMNVPGNLRITDKSGKIITVAHEGANRIVQEGVIHPVDDVFEYVE